MPVTCLTLKQLTYIIVMYPHQNLTYQKTHVIFVTHKTDPLDYKVTDKFLLPSDYSLQNAPLQRLVSSCCFWSTKQLGCQSGENTLVEYIIMT